MRKRKRSRGGGARGRIRFHRVSGFRRNFHLGASSSGTRTTVRSTTRSTTTSTGTPISWTRISSTGGRCRRPPAPPSCGLADAELIPVDYSPQAEAIAKYEAELEKLLKDKQDEFTERESRAAGGRVQGDARSAPAAAAAAAPRPVPPFINFAPMKNAVALLKKSAERYSAALAAFAAKGSPDAAASLARAHQRGSVAGVARVSRTAAAFPTVRGSRTRSTRPAPTRGTARSPSRPCGSTWTRSAGAMRRRRCRRLRR